MSLQWLNDETQENTLYWIVKRVTSLTLLLLRTSSRCHRLSATFTLPGNCSTTVPEPWLIFKVGVPSISSRWRGREAGRVGDVTFSVTIRYEESLTTTVAFAPQKLTDACHRINCYILESRLAVWYIIAKSLILSVYINGNEDYCTEPAVI